ncbi:MAG: DUF805 domain-containing protein [Bacillota bacterium]
MICNQCKLQIDSKDETCPYCGAPNPQFKKSSISTSDNANNIEKESFKCQPQPQQYFLKGFINMYKQYFNFKGTTSRGEFWSIQLILFLLLLPFMFVYMTTEPEAAVYTTAQVWIIDLTAAFLFASLIPIVALSVRRLHDANFIGWLFLLNLIIGFGSLVVILLLLSPHKKNKYELNH